MDSNMHLLIMTVYFGLAVLNIKCNGQYQSRCDVFPQRQHVQAGSDTEFICVSACEPGNISWTLNDRRLDGGLSRRINSTHTALLLPYALLPDPSIHNIINVQCHSDIRDQLLGGSFIHVYTKPHNLSCILHSNGERKMGLPRLVSCNWEHQVYSPVKIDYAVICDQCASDQNQICTSAVTSCDVHLLNTSISFVKRNTIYVQAKAEAWEARSKPYSFNASHIFKIPPRSVNVTVRPDHVLVEWDSLPNLNVNGRCQVQYTKEGKIVKETLNKALAPGEKGRLVIDNVESCRTYSVSVRCALDRALWSEWSPERKILTKLKKSDVKLDVWRKVSKLDGQKYVRVMWKGIPWNCSGILSYSISHVPYNSLTSRENYTRALCSNNSCDIFLNHKAHTVNLTVSYNGHFLAEDSFYLPASAEDESDSLFCVKSIDTKHEINALVVRWTAPSQPVSAYVIDWTHNGREFDWKRTQFTNITLQGLIDKKPYNITVTPLFGRNTGPSTQVSGVCSSFANPENATIDSVEAYDTSAHVSWSMKQHPCSDPVMNYTVFYWTGKSPQLNVTVENTMWHTYLKSLKRDTYYFVQVVARANAGTSVSAELPFKTKSFDPRLISIFSVTGSIFIVICLCLCCAIRKFYEKPVPNPGLSSLALWSQNTYPKTIMPFGPFNTPSESLCERVYTEEMHQTSSINTVKSPVIRDPKKETSFSSLNYERPFLSAGSTHQDDARDLLLLQSSEKSPYRSQTADSSAPKNSKQNKRLDDKLQKAPSYVSLDLFES